MGFVLQPPHLALLGWFTLFDEDAVLVQCSQSGADGMESEAAAQAQLPLWVFSADLAVLEDAEGDPRFAVGDILLPAQDLAHRLVEDHDLLGGEVVVEPIHVQVWVLE